MGLKFLDRMTYVFLTGIRNQLTFYPARELPDWCVYQVRVIPLNSQGLTTAYFSNASLLTLLP